VGEFMHPVYITFQTALSNWAETDLKCNTGIKKNRMPLAFYHIQTVGAYTHLAVMFLATVLMN
jgi:hypothetical protein